MQIKHITFKNRDDASQQLIKELPIDEMKNENWIILATSFGGIPIAMNIAKELKAEIDFLFTKKVFTPKNNECEIAIITETGEIVIHEVLLKTFNLTVEDIYQDINSKYNNELIKYKTKYRKLKNLINLENKNILLVDEGLNTGLTMMACIKSVISQKAKSIRVAVPILPKVTIYDIETIADDLYYVEAPSHFLSIDFYYKDLKDIDINNTEILKGK
jgi:putative phosphoribosyl transferase